MAKGNVTCNDIIKFIAHGTAMPSYGANWELHLLPHEIAQRRRLWLKLQRDKAEAAKQKRRNDELALLAMYGLTRKAA